TTELCFTGLSIFKVHQPMFRISDRKDLAASTGSPGPQSVNQREFVRKNCLLGRNQTVFRQSKQCKRPHQSSYFVGDFHEKTSVYSRYCISGWWLWPG